MRRDNEYRVLLAILALLLGDGCATTEATKARQDSDPAAQRAKQPARPARQAVEQVRQPPNDADTIAAIASAIERLKDSYPQLQDFAAARHCDRQRLVISYGYRTHPSRHRGGWTAGVPNPDEDGIWFYIDFHDPGSMAQIHTQPVVPDRHLGDKKVMLLLLEGKRTRSLGAAIERILAQHGVQCRGC